MKIFDFLKKKFLFFLHFLNLTRFMRQSSGNLDLKKHTQPGAKSLFIQNPAKKSAKKIQKWPFFGLFFSESGTFLHAKLWV